MIFLTKNKNNVLKIITLYIVFSLISVNTFGQQDALNKRVSIYFSNLPLLKALNLLSKEHATPLSFDPALIPAEKQINKKFKNERISSILDAILAETGLTYKVLFKEIIIVPLDEVSLSGRVVDGESGEDLIGVALYIPALKQGINTNNYGFYSITLPRGAYEIQVSHVGYVPFKLSLSLMQKNESRIIRMQKQVNELQEIQIREQSNKDSLPFISPGKTLNWDIARQQTYFKGESDVVKALQMENGITALTEGSSHMFIRGGNKDQNLIMLDEAIVYNPAHLFGLTSIFNPDALKNIQVYTDGMPASFGGRLSSVIDVRMADGDDKQFHAKGGISLLTARASLEGPIVKEKGSFFFAARRSLSNLLSQDLQLFDLRPSYFDFNFKANYKLTVNDRLYISAYAGRDKVVSVNGYLNKWGNQTSTLRWNHIFNPKLFLNLSAIYSNYKNQLSINADAAEGTDKWITGIRDATLKGDFNYYANLQNQFQFGFSSILHLFIPGESRSELFNNISRVQAGEHALYFSHKLSAWENFKLFYGLRVSFFHNISTYDLDDFFKPTIVQDGLKARFIRFEPRFSLQYMLKPNAYLQFNYNRNYQYLQLVQNDELAFSSLESWIPSGINLLPQQSDFFSLKYKNVLFGGTYTVDLYYKKMQNQLELIDHAQLISNPFIESQLRPGYSNAYGLEFSFSKDIDRFKGNLMYTFSKVYRTITGINEGKRYPAGYDIPHALKLGVGYRISESLSANSFFTYTTGRPVTFPIGYFDQKGLKIPIYGERNSTRMPSYQRLDLTLQWSPSPIKIWRRNLTHTFSAGVYNVYNRRNPMFYRINQQDLQELNFDQQAFSGRTLGLSYNFKF